MNEETLSNIKMLLCAFLWSIAGIFIKQINWNSVVIAGARSLFAAIIIYLFMAKSHYKIRTDKKSLTTGIFLCLTFILFVSSNKMTTAANAIVLQSASPVFILIFSYLFFKQKMHKADIIAVVATLIGISLFFFDKLGGGKLSGNILGLFSAVTLALMYTSLVNCTEEERMNGIFWGNAFTALVGMPFMLFTENVITPISIIFIIILGVFQLGIPYILLVQASRKCPPLTCSLLGMLEPLLNPVWVFIFDGEKPGIMSLIGAAIVIITITAWCIAKEKIKNRVTES